MSTAARQSLDALIERRLCPGVQCTVVDRSGPRLTYAGGWADLRARVPMSPATTLMAYSMSKTITAAAVLRLVAAGLVSLDDPLQRFFDNPYGPGVTLRRLLSHTAGLPSPIPLSWVHPAPEHASFDERGALDAVLRRHGTLSSAPGHRFRYSNLGYWLLGPVVERASGLPFSTYVERELLAPLGLAPHALGYAIADTANHASGYLEKWSFMNLVKRLVLESKYIDRYDGPWLRIHAHYLNGPAFGGLIGTASALGVFLSDQLAPASKVLPDDARPLFCEQQSTRSGKPVPMTLGWHIDTVNGEPCYFKEGGGGGFHSMMRLYPSRGVGSVMIANATGFNVRRALDDVDRHFLNGT